MGRPMSRKVKLETTQSQFDDLHQGANAKRGTMCKVSKAALKSLLLDHGRLIKYASQYGDLEGQT